MAGVYNLKKGVAPLSDLSDVTATAAEVNTLSGGVAVQKVTETVAFGDFTDGESATAPTK